MQRQVKLETEGAGDQERTDERWEISFSCSSMSYPLPVYSGDDDGRYRLRWRGWEKGTKVMYGTMIGIRITSA
jgi:hypothetical protein